VEDQVSVALCPTVIVVGATASDAVGVGAEDPPPPPPPLQPARALPKIENAISFDHFAAIACSFFMT
jgi:hypothetical protein